MVSRPTKSGSRKAGLLLLLAAFVLVAEIAWFSEPVQEWRLARLSASDLARRATAEPYNTRVLYHHALALRRAGRDEDAAGTLHNAVVMEPSSRRLLVALGETLVRMGQTEKAEPYLRQAITLGETGAAVRAALARLEQERGNYGQAVTEWQAVLRARPEDAAAWHGLGVCEAQRLRPEEWLEAATTAARLEPRNGEYQRTLGEALAHQERWEDAERAFSEALRLDESDARARYQLAALRGRRATTPEEVAAVEAAFRRAAAVLPDDPALHLALGRFYEARGRWSDAAREFAAALRADPENERASYQLAMAYRRQGNAAAAEATLAAFKRTSDLRRTIRYLTARISQEPNNAALRVRLGRAQSALRESNLSHRGHRGHGEGRNGSTNLR